MEGKELCIVVTLDGVFGFIGVLSKNSDNTAVVLNNALTIGYDTDGMPYPTFGQLPAGAADPRKPTRTAIPVKNISYMVGLGENDGHELVEKYKRFFELTPDGMAAD